MCRVLKSFLCLSLSFCGELKYCMPVNVPLLMDIIHHGDGFVHFPTFPILSQSSVLFEVQDVIIELQNTIQRPVFIYSEKNNNSLFRYNIFSQSLVLVFMPDLTEKLLDMCNTFTRGRRFMAIIFVLTETSKESGEISQIMERIWIDKYMRAMLLYRDNRGDDHLITFDPYSKFKLVSLLETYKTTDVFTFNEKANLNGYLIRTPAKFDMPRVFRVIDYDGGMKIKGAVFQMFKSYVEYKNATFEESDKDTSSMGADRGQIFEMVSDGSTEMSLHAQIVQYYENVESSYPILLNDVCFMLPVANEIPSYMYLWLPFRIGTWILVVCGTIYLAFILLWIHPQGRLKIHKDYGLSLLQSIGYMLHISTWGHYYTVSWRYFFIYVAATLLGFLITTWYCAALKSFLTATVYGHQIDTVDELMASGLKILLTEFDANDGVRMVHLPKKIRQIYSITDMDGLNRHRNALNTTYAYTIALDRWEFLNQQQEFLKRPIFRITDICFLKHHIGFPMVYDSRLKYSLDSFIMNILQSGLMDYWWRADFKYAVREGYAKFMIDFFPLEPLHIDDIRLAWEILGVGWAISAAVFMGEVFWVSKRGKLTVLKLKKVFKRGDS